LNLDAASVCWGVCCLHCFCSGQNEVEETP
jgi:hypothetical protein